MWLVLPQSPWISNCEVRGFWGEMVIGGCSAQDSKNIGVDENFWMLLDISAGCNNCWTDGRNETKRNERTNKSVAARLTPQGYFLGLIGCNVSSRYPLAREGRLLRFTMAIYVCSCWSSSMWGILKREYCQAWGDTMRSDFFISIQDDSLDPFCSFATKEG